MSDKPSVLFVCVKNGGKSQMAAGLLRDVAGDELEVHSGGTHPGDSINALSAQAMAEVGVDLAGEHPKPIDPELLARMDYVITVGVEATLHPVEGPTYLTWDTDEPSARGIGGMERMRLVRNDIAARVDELAARLIVAPEHSPASLRPDVVTELSR